MTEFLLSFLITYAIHSSILLLCAEGLDRLFHLSTTAREVVWKFALFGGIVSASLATSGLPRVATMNLTRTVPVESSEPALETPAGEPRSFAEPAIPRRPVEGDDVHSSKRPPVRGIVLTTWAIGMCLFFGRLGAHQRSAMKRLRSRRHIVDGELVEFLTALRRNAGVWRPIRLSVDSYYPTPLALGLSEICVPERFLTDLDRKQQEAALAHELAHLVRRDPVWNVVTRVVESIFFFQPLNLLASSRIRSIAELSSDEWAVRRIGSGTDLARGLTSIAFWINDSRITARAVIAMPGGGAPLSQRVERLLSGIHPSGRAPISAAVLSFGLVVVVSTGAPAVIPPHDDGRTSPFSTPISETSLLAEGIPDEDGNYSWSGFLAHGAVEVKGPVGDIRFSRTSGPDVEIRAVTDGRQYRDVRFEVVKHEAGLTICAIFPPSPSMPENRCEPGPWTVHSSMTKARADFAVKIPAGIDAIAHNMTGNVLVWSPPADVVIRNGTGFVALVFEEPGWQGHADITNGSGDITIRHAGSEAIRIDAESKNGRIETDLPIRGYTSWVPGSGPLEGLHGESPTGGAVRARNEFGDIEFLVW